MCPLPNQSRMQSAESCVVERSTTYRRPCDPPTDMPIKRTSAAISSDFAQPERFLDLPLSYVQRWLGLSVTGALKTGQGGARENWPLTRKDVRQRSPQRFPLQETQDDELTNDSNDFCDSSHRSGHRTGRTSGRRVCTGRLVAVVFAGRGSSKPA